MKNMMISLLLIFLLAACSNAESEENIEGTEPEKTEAEVVDEGEEASEEKTEQKEDEEETKEEKTDEEAETEETVQEPQYKLGTNWAFEPIGDANPKVALLTIDDAPEKFGVEMAKKLKELNAPAIFFVNGHFIDTEEEKAMLKEIHDMGFAIGNHTHSHASLPDLTEEQQRTEIVGLNDQIEKITGERPEFFRAPFGQNTDFSKQLAEQENMLVMNWTYGYDWNKEYMEASKIADIMVNTELLNNGANLLMHDREWTNNALPEIVEGLRGKGYELLDPALIQTP
ncbi:polysaccharide deacetylase family protein [Halobacillus locisalis]|uniref:Polysaccharide deacetylase family protein n=1 Tax=Halobacillus locisalis TaxID=220753 RepID=A0A838CR22_9BACI|nr:polysaccharide deacetylase family protein [Halobacillus locisalis]MBA2174323.1 polysaccharide deacetylase family protein [Halobacillus locisalis]